MLQHQFFCQYEMDQSYGSTIELEIILHKQIHIYKGILTMFGVRRSSSSLASPFITFFLIGSYDEYGISQLSLSTNHMNLFKPYSFLVI